MKEVTYGWYPSAQDIYRPKGRPSSYHLECLYKYNNSMYYQDKALPPKPELFVRGISSGTPPPTPEDLRRRAKSVPVPKFTPTPKLHIPTPADCWARSRVEETKWGVVGDEATLSPAPPSELSWPLTKDGHHQKAIEHLQNDFAVRSTLQSTWDPTGSVPQPPSRCCGPVSTPMKWPAAQHTDIARPQTASTAGQKIKSAWSTQRFVRPEMTPAPPSRQSSASSRRPPRTQSATVHRVKTTLPSRPVTAGPDRQASAERIKPASAGSVDQHSLDNASRNDFQTKELKESQQGEAGVPRELIVSEDEEVSAPTKPFVYDVNDVRPPEVVARAEKVVPATSEGDDYDTLVVKYGWRAQIPGDPFKFRKPQPRLRYAVPCPEPDLLPDPPAVHMESKETFFYNTIPKRPLSFTVSKEWMSEVLLAKRLELQKRDGGIKYNYKNFAFVY